MFEGVIDIDILLAPLQQGEGGTGEDLRNDASAGSPYQALRDARANARAEERAQDAMGEDEAAIPDAWREVKRLSLFCLSEKSKDFQVAAWLAEALVRVDGLPGLAAAAQVITGLADRYWETGFPRPDEDGLDARSSPLAGLAGSDADGTLMQPIRRMPLFHRPDGRSVSLYLWNSAEEVAAISDGARKKARLAAGVPELTALETAARSSARDLRRIALAARAAGDAWTSMAATLDARFGEGGPSTKRVTDVLNSMVRIGERIAGALPQEVTQVIEDEAAAAIEAAPGAAEESAAIGEPPALHAVRNRDDAIRLIEEIAEWFRRTEPHSPLAYTLDSAVRRARLPLTELLAEVLPDEKTRAGMLNLLGIRVEKQSGE